MSTHLPPRVVVVGRERGGGREREREGGGGREKGEGAREREREGGRREGCVCEQTLSIKVETDAFCWPCALSGTVVLDVSVFKVESMRGLIGQNVC